MASDQPTKQNTKQNISHPITYIDFHVERESKKNGLRVSVIETPNGWMISAELPLVHGPIFDSDYMENLTDLVGNEAEHIMDSAIDQMNKAIIKELLFK